MLGDDWVAPRSTVGEEMRDMRSRRGFFSVRGSPLTRKIIVFNMIALIILVSGILYLNSSRESLVAQRAGALVGEARLIANVFEAQLSDGTPVNLAASDGVDVAQTLDVLTLRQGVEVYVFDTAEAVVGYTQGTDEAPGKIDTEKTRNTPLSDTLTAIWRSVASVFSSPQQADPADPVEDQLRAQVKDTVANGTRIQPIVDEPGGTEFAVLAPILQGGTAVGVVALLSPSGEIDALVRSERERVLQMFVVALLVSVGLSLVLASTIANPLADLAEAAELGRDRNARKMNPERIRIPDLTARPDEIGRLSRALRGMVSALYTRIDGNEQFAADVAHEIKNPLTSLRSAVETLRIAKTPEMQARLLLVIEKDVRRLDRLVTDISNASRLDAELVREEMVRFDLRSLIETMADLNLSQADERDARIVVSPGETGLYVRGLEGRIGQVLQNLLGNALSFAPPKSAVTISAYQSGNAVRVQVDDQGAGIPDENLGSIFERFYSERPDHEEFGNHSGLGLSISRQIIEAHGGTIWAENIRPPDQSDTPPMGARFIFELPA